MSRQGLMDEYFPVDDEDRDRKIQDEQSLVVENLRSLVTSPGWEMLRDRFNNLVLRSEIAIGTEQEMHFQIGRREALIETKTLFDVMEQELRNESRASKS